MGRSVWHITMSLDGFIAGPDDSMQWAFDAFKDYGPEGMGDEIMRSTGAILAGRHWYEVPAEVDLHHSDLVALEGEDLGVAKPPAIGLRALVGNDDFVAGLDEPLELERVDQLGVRPAPLEVGLAVPGSGGL
jgi:hypothetical protein